MLNVRSGRKTRATIALIVVATLAPRAIALNRSLDVSQYAHTVWKASEGFSPGVISSIAQTPVIVRELGKSSLHTPSVTQSVPQYPINLREQIVTLWTPFPGGLLPIPCI
jgi:hypothetical protein